MGMVQCRGSGNALKAALFLCVFLTCTANDDRGVHDPMIIFPPYQKVTTRSPSPMFRWFKDPITSVKKAVEFWFHCREKMARDADPLVAQDRLDFPLTPLEQGFCHQLEHRLWHEKRKHARPAMGNRAENAQATVERLHVYPRFGETLPTHKAFFAQYSSAGQPLVLEELGKRMVPETGMLDGCVQGHEAGQEEISLPHHCVAFLRANYKIPDFLAADLYQAPIFRDDEGGFLGKHCNRWPIAKVQRAGYVEPLAETTFGSHALILAVHGEIEVKLYRREHHPFLLPTFRNESWLGDPSHVYNAEAFGDGMGDKAPCFATELGENDAIYVPSGYIYSWKILPHKGGGADPKTTVVVHEFLDAAALSTHKEEFRRAMLRAGKGKENCDDNDDGGTGSAAADPGGRRLQNGGEANRHRTPLSTNEAYQEKQKSGRALKGEVQEDDDDEEDGGEPLSYGASPSHGETPSAMVKYYQALRALHTESVVVQQTYWGMMSWDDYKAFPRPDPPSPKNRREKYKLWQAKKSWEQKLLHFTGPAPSSVTVGSITQTSVDLIVTFPKDLPKLFFKEVFDCFYVSGFTVFDIVVPDDTVETHPSLPFLARNVSGTALSESSYRVTVGGLRPKEVYIICVAARTKLAKAESSEPIFVRTPAFTVPAPPPAPEITNTQYGGRSVLSAIRVRLPGSNGGHGITAFSLRWERTDGLYPFVFEPIYHKVEPEMEGVDRVGFDSDGWMHLNVENLVPGAKYKFQVACENELGLGPYSPFSGEMLAAEQPDGAAVALISGVRHAYRHTHNYRRLARKGPTIWMLYEAQSLKLSVNDVDSDDEYFGEVFTEDSPEIIIPAWRSHFTPPYDVKGDVVVSEPVFAEEQLWNADDVKGAIVLVRRGKVPFLTKARHAVLAGAVGMILVDDGRCTGEGEYDWEDTSQLCVVGSVRGNGDGFAREDHPEGWENIKIPTYLILEKSGGDLLRLVQVSTSKGEEGFM